MTEVSNYFAIPESRLGHQPPRVVYVRIYGEVIHFTMSDWRILPIVKTCKTKRQQQLQ